MDKHVIQAIKDSIEHWKRNKQRALNHQDPEISPKSCALCNLFRNEKTDPSTWCKGCPISTSTKRKYCDGTPYTEIYQLVRQLRKWKGLFIFQDSISKKYKMLAELCELEIKFLTSLLMED